MRKILFALVLMWPTVVFGQSMPDTYAVATPAQFQGFNASTATGITSAIISRAIRVVCTAACNIWINASGQNFTPTVATGFYIPANTPQDFSVTPGSKVKVLGNSGTGQLYVMELTR